jgi:hypothetical protein
VAEIDRPLELPVDQMTDRRRSLAGGVVEQMFGTPMGATAPAGSTAGMTVFTLTCVTVGP